MRLAWFKGLFLKAGPRPRPAKESSNEHSKPSHNILSLHAPPSRFWAKKVLHLLTPPTTNLLTCIWLGARALSFLWLLHYDESFCLCRHNGRKPCPKKRQNFASLKYWKLKTTGIEEPFKISFCFEESIETSSVSRDSWLPRLSNEIGGKIWWRNAKWRLLLPPLVRWQHLKRFQKVRTYFMWSYNVFGTYR